MKNISLGELKSRELDIVYLDFEEKIDSIDIDGRRVKVTAPVKVEGSIANTDEGMYLDCRIMTVIEDSCSRCLTNIQVEIDAQAQGFLVHEAEEEEALEGEEDVFLYEGEVLNFHNIIRDTIIINIPQKLLCSDECKGICPGCGVDLNVEECKCSKEQKDERLTDPRFEKLKDLL